ncbi:acetyl-CoA carboxylase biotin carboxyl carrier protein subunit [Lactobacillus pentosus]|jgi:biotin carboxyl carrier protein|uniref:Acetyl-CoA carboxylase biotin carboxyl carrier protein subunit n=1 Tax=Lactiplantibacillus pentosus TaxID=1589 RepID=A0AB37RFN6_LACPE|nr:MULTISPECIES: acetyl-CoA carboxylase biotin carboxyl carrier protein subunit [Lactiplantibacillus]MCH4129504.1 acetyl-CoA carboxylase biotin carboxyl carrier protein subunit [Lactiplantibacillus sp.]BBM21305.1 oxaloacetate decarboxylase, gamma subunit [Lactiplantibacillus plantarum]MBO9164560.1 acetyl-CoA carboxylase biotin carboxyl carrier protein subunit [Lactiplantibacillus pentosus]MBU7448989.1 acetyl-CoA carboxylase biotin carboxyl carrier protein subunit [Lactiplantibacillus sp. 7.2.4]
MLRKFKITINGETYLVEMEELGDQASQTAVSQSTSAPTTMATPTTPPAEPAAVAQSAQVPTAAVPATAMTAPMPGVIIKLLVTPGETVQENQPLLVLEAMKMENEIVANKAGTVDQLFVSKNDSVNAGDPLIQIS